MPNIAIRVKKTIELPAAQTGGGGTCILFILQLHLFLSIYNRNEGTSRPYRSVGTFTQTCRLLTIFSLQTDFCSFLENLLSKLRQIRTLTDAEKEIQQRISSASKWLLKI